jgi:diacylglycerol kinase family enzyme
MQIEVLLNEGAGAVTAELAKIQSAFSDANLAATVRRVEGSDLRQAAQAARARGVDAVIAAGGDGTVSAVASALAGGQTPLGVLPLGTLNHFAKDIGIPLDLAGSVGVIAEGRISALDVGRVNDRVFVNNSSLGVYARALIDRDVRRDRWGLSKWPAMLLASWRVFRRSPMMRVRLATGDETVVRKTPLVFVGNNAYDLELFRVGSRKCLDDGVLSLYVATTTSRWGMVKLGVRAALGGLEQSRDFETNCVAAVSIDSRRSRVHVAVDGEIVRLDTPLDYSVWPGALRVFVPGTERQSLVDAAREPCEAV